MHQWKLFISLILAISILMVQVGGVFAASTVPASTLIIGKVHRITLDTDPNTGITTVTVELTGSGQGKQIVRISQETAIGLGLIALDLDGPVINTLALGKIVEIKSETVIPGEPEDRHPVGNALATFFSDIADEETLYAAIMKARDEGTGFGVIAQALWLTLKLEADAEVFELILDAKESNDYSALEQYVDEGVTPTNWGQFRKAILIKEDRKNSVGDVMSNSNGNQSNQNRDNHGNANRDNSNKDKEKEKKK